MRARVCISLYFSCLLIRPVVRVIISWIRVTRHHFCATFMVVLLVLSSVTIYTARKGWFHGWEYFPISRYALLVWSRRGFTPPLIQSTPWLWVSPHCGLVKTLVQTLSTFHPISGPFFYGCGFVCIQLVIDLSINNTYQTIECALHRFVHRPRYDSGQLLTKLGPLPTCLCDWAQSLVSLHASMVASLQPSLGLIISDGWLSSILGS